MIKKLLEEIRAQPLWVRHLFMWSMVVITFTLVGAWYVSRPSSSIVALFSAPQATPSPHVVAEDTGTSPFTAVKNSWSSMTAQISKIFVSNTTDPEATPVTTQPPVAPQRLP